MIILDTPYAELSFNQENQLAMIRWKGKATSEEYRNAFNVLLDFQNKQTITRYISDIRKQAIISPVDRKWFETVAMPRAIQQGLKAATVIFDGNAFKKYYINVIINATNKYGLPMKVFNDLEEAKLWLMQK